MGFPTRWIVLGLAFLADAVAWGGGAVPPPLAFSPSLRGKAGDGGLGLGKMGGGSRGGGGGAGGGHLMRRRGGGGGGRALVMQGPLYEPLRRGTPFDNLPQRGAEVGKLPSTSGS